MEENLKLKLNLQPSGMEYKLVVVDDHTPVCSNLLALCILIFLLNHSVLKEILFHICFACMISAFEGRKVLPRCSIGISTGEGCRACSQISSPGVFLVGPIFSCSIMCSKLHPAQCGHFQLNPMDSIKGLCNDHDCDFYENYDGFVMFMMTKHLP